jgi:hypothetical protein
MTPLYTRPLPLWVLLRMYCRSITDVVVHVHLIIDNGVWNLFCAVSQGSQLTLQAELAAQAAEKQQAVSDLQEQVGRLQDQVARAQVGPSPAQVQTRLTHMYTRLTSVSIIQTCLFPVCRCTNGLGLQVAFCLCSILTLQQWLQTEHLSTCMQQMSHGNTACAA